MFIRRKVKTAKGQSYEQHQLLKSVRTPGGPRQEVVLSMGQLDLPKDQWKALANAIEDKLNNQTPLALGEGCAEIEKLAAHFAQMIVSKSINQAQDGVSEKDFGAAASAQAQAADYQNVDVNSMKTTESRSIGAEYVIAEQMNRYGLDKILQDLDFSPQQIHYAKYLVIGRAVHPSSERELARWINDDSALQELTGGTGLVYDNALHRTAALLWEHRVELQERLRLKAKELFSLDEKIILYDLTNTYFEGKKTGSAKAQFGRSKEKRSDCKLMTLALVVDSLGFPKESHILEGNVSEPGTLAGMLKSIQALGRSTERKTLVIDAGIATEENIALLQKEKISYVAISRKRSHDPSIWAQSQAKKIPLNDRKTELTVKLATVKTQPPDSNQASFSEALLLCHSPQKEIKERQILERRLSKFEAAIGELNAGLSKPGTTRKFGKIMERIGRLKEKFHVGECFDIKVSESEGIVREITCKRNLKSVAKTGNTGEYVIRTDRLDLREEEMSCVHRGLTTIESSFRVFKSDLGLRPNYHKSEEATTAHMFLSVLAYHMVCPILKRLSESGLDYTWSSVRNLLSSHDRVVTAFNTQDEYCIYIKNTTTANLSQKSIYDGLGIKHDPLENKYFKRKINSTRQM
jgi:transposase